MTRTGYIYLSYLLKTPTLRVFSFSLNNTVFACNTMRNAGPIAVLLRAAGTHLIRGFGGHFTLPFLHKTDRLKVAVLCVLVTT